MSLNKRVKIFCMQKDEDDILNEWILYHANLFGLNNLYIIDNNSGLVSKNILDYYHTQGLNVFTRSDYAKKGDYICEMIAEVQNQCDLVIPLDLDEFIGVVNLDNLDPIIKSKWVQQCLSFDAKFYGSMYPDLITECQKRQWTLFDHFTRYGFHEQRQVCATEQIQIINASDCDQYIRKHQKLILKTYPELVISCDPKQIYQEINQLPSYGRYAFIQYLTSRNTELEYSNPIEDVVYFNKIDMEHFEGQGNFNKKFFEPKLLEALDHGHHYGRVTGLHKTQYHESNLCLFHFHYRGIHKLIQKCRNDILGFGHVKNINDIRELKDKIRQEVPGCHNIQTYLSYITSGPYSLSMSEHGGVEIMALSHQMKSIKGDLQKKITDTN